MAEVIEYDATIFRAGGTSYHISAQANVDRPRSHGWIDLQRVFDSDEQSA